MKYTGLYLIPNLTNELETSQKYTKALVHGIESAFPYTTQRPGWILTYRAFRDTVLPGTTIDRDKPFPHTYQHILHLSSLAPSKSYIYIQPPGAKNGNITAIPHAQQDAYTMLLRTQFLALWSTRHILAIVQGQTYTCGPCTIQLGEIRMTREGPQSGGIPSPGVIVSISLDNGAEPEDDVEKDNHEIDTDDEMDFESAQAVIRECWAKIKRGQDTGRGEVREVLMESKEVKGNLEKEAAVRMWCDILRLRG